jgi:hypothetical protein
MRLSCCVLLLTLLPLAAMAQAPDVASLTYSLSEGRALVTLNGFPVLNDTTATQMSGGQPVNLHLVPTGNRLEVDFAPASDASTVHLALRGSSRGEVVGTDDVGDLVDVTLDGADGAQTVTETFDLPEAWRARYTAGRLYAEAPAITDRAAVEDYALRLLDLVAQEDYAALAAEMLPRLRAQRAVTPSAGMPEDDDALVTLFGQMLQRQFDGMTAHTDVDPDDLALTPWADGRLWELARADGQALLSATDADGGTFEIPAFVARVDGALKVVR